MRQTFPGTEIAIPEGSDACKIESAKENRSSVPSVREIRRRMAEIRRGWTEAERCERAAIASRWEIVPILLGFPRQPRRAAR